MTLIDEIQTIMTLIDGKATAAAIKQEIAAEVQQMLAEGKRAPHLAAVLVGHDGGSETYVAAKVKACAECGFTSSLIRFERWLHCAASFAEAHQQPEDH